MIFQPHIPAEHLRSLVQCYLEADCRGSLEGGVNTLFPNGFSGIFFNFGNHAKMNITQDSDVHRVSVFGQIDRHFTITHVPGFYSIGVLLKPTVLSWLLRVDMSEFTNRAFDGALIRRDLYSLYRHLAEAEGIKKKIELLNHYFTKALATFQNQFFIDHAVYLLQNPGNHSIEKLAQNLGVSQRYLEIHFKKSIGLSPKTYSLIMRFKSVEQQVRKMSMIRWQDMEFASEYHDQNHFIKDFKRFTGLTPSTYLLENLEMGRSYLTV